MVTKRRLTKKIRVGALSIGGDAPITIQSMTTTPTSDTQKTAAQIAALAAAGCDLVRLAVTDEADATAAKVLLADSAVPLVADIQFDWRLAQLCSQIGFDKIRFNPGNIGSEQNVRELVAVCRDNGTPIRIGVNAGSLEKDLLQRFGRSAEALSESALRHVSVLEKAGFYDIVLSVKSSSVPTMINAYRLISERCDYPLHLGVTESGAKERGLVKSAIGIGTLLQSGIGDTIRVSLTGDPIEEVRAAQMILQSLKLRVGCEVVSCPTCARCKIDLAKIAEQVTALTQNITKPLKIAVMGCVVNGPGEAADADFGLAGGEGKAVLFEKGKIIKTVPENEIMREMQRLIAKHTAL